MSRKKGKSMLEQMRDHNAATMHTFEKVEKPASTGSSKAWATKTDDEIVEDMRKMNDSLGKYGVLEGKL